ncbi:MAG: hypothetical protein ABL931_05455 [Usitatibacteraceae bacterium]
MVVIRPTRLRRDPSSPGTLPRPLDGERNFLLGMIRKSAKRSSLSPADAEPSKLINPVVARRER